METISKVSLTISFSGFLLCRTCGEDSSVLNLIDNSRISDFNLGLTNITIGSKEVLVQDLKNPRGINFKVLISKKANCARTSGVSRVIFMPILKFYENSFNSSGSATQRGLKDSLGKFVSARFAERYVVSLIFTR